MKSKNWIVAGSFCVVSLLITFLIYNRTIEGAQGQSMYSLAIELTKGAQFRQIILSTCIYAYGYIVVKAFRLEKNEWWDAVLAYPVGILSWCILGAAVLILGIPFEFVTMLVGLAGLLIVCVGYMKRHTCQFKVANFFHNLLYAVGIAAIASSGLFWVYMANDSLYYLVKYGEILAIDGGFSQNVSYWMTWIGITPAMLSSLAKFLGLYSIYTIHHMLMVSFILFFIITIYEKMRESLSVKKTIMVVIAAVILLFLTPAFFLLGQWVISNTYFMIYMYIFFYVICEVQDKKMNAKGAYILLGLISVFLTLSRSESIVTMCFLIICASTLKVEKIELFKYVLVPSSVFQVAYWIRVYLVQGYLFEGMLTGKNVAVMVLAFVGTGLYLLFIGAWFENKYKLNMQQVVVYALIGINIILFLLTPERGIEGIDVFSYNLANESWGFFPWLVAFCYLVFVCKDVKMNYWDMCWIGYVLFSFGICMGRGTVARIGIGDSLNRIICSIVPVIWFAIIMHMKELYVKERVCDRETDRTR